MQQEADHAELAQRSRRPGDRLADRQCTGVEADARSTLGYDRAVLGAQYALAGRSVRSAARVFAVSPRSISRAQLVLQDGNRALVAEMLEGRWSLTVAASLVTSTQTLLQTLNQRAGQAAEPVSEVA